MSKTEIHKTNAMRELGEVGVSYEMSSYPTGGEIDAVHAAQLLGVSPEVIYKTLVLEDGNGGHFVAVIAAQVELDLKKTAAHSGVKHVGLINWKTLREVTGYIHRGCSPLATKRLFPTVIDENVVLQERVYVSAGVRGTQIVVPPSNLARVVGAGFAAVAQQRFRRLRFFAAAS